MRLFVASIFGTVIYFASFLGPFYRDLILFSKVDNSNTPEIIEDCRRFLDPDIPDMRFPQKKEVLGLFHAEKKSIPFTLGDKLLHANVLIFNTELENAKGTHTCVRIGGSDETIAGSPMRVIPYLTAFSEKYSDKNLCFIQISYHDIEEGGKAWKPTKLKQVGEATFALMRALKNQGLAVDSLICHSMGGISLTYLNDVQDPSEVPNLIILDRAIPSVWKVGLKHYSLPVTFVMHEGAKLFGWSADCEKALLAFYKRDPYVAKRKVLIIEAEEDYYFSDKSAFEKNLAAKLNKVGVEAFQHRFFVNRLHCHERAHHALPIHYLTNHNSKPIGSETFTVEPYENVAQAIARSFFS